MCERDCFQLFDGFSLQPAVNVDIFCLHQLSVGFSGAVLTYDVCC